MSAASTSRSTGTTIGLAALGLGLIGVCSALARARVTRRATAAAAPTSSAALTSAPAAAARVAAPWDPNSAQSQHPSAAQLAAIYREPSSRDAWTTAFPNVRFNPSFWTKLDAIREAGPLHLVSIVDFDWTLTGYMGHDGRTVCKTSYGVLTSSPLIPESDRRALAEIKNQYFRYERDEKLTLEQRSAYMVRWWNEIHENMLNLPKHLKYGWTRPFVRECIKLAVDNNDVFLRQGSVEFLRALNRAGTPLLVMSAGLAQTVEETLRLREAFYANAEVCANVMQFNLRDELVSFAPALPIHSSSKSFLSVSQESKFRSAAAKRGDASGRPCNVLLVGDTIGDTDMSTGLTVNQRLAIGFVNADTEKRSAEFLAADKYDAVILNDGNWDLILVLLRTIGINAD